MLAQIFADLVGMTFVNSLLRLAGTLRRLRPPRALMPSLMFWHFGPLA
jgi:hypothetical protein